jgi:hypothetical protein
MTHKRGKRERKGGEEMRHPLTLYFGWAWTNGGWAPCSPFLKLQKSLNSKTLKI